MKDEYVSPWDAGAEEVPDFENFALPSHTEEIEIWQRRAHELWTAASASGDLRSSAQALNVAFRGLRDRQSALETAERAKTTRAEVPEGQTPCTIEAIDKILRESDKWFEENGYVENCPTCGHRVKKNVYDERAVAVYSGDDLQRKGARIEKIVSKLPGRENSNGNANNS